MSSVPRGAGPTALLVALVVAGTTMVFQQAAVMPLLPLLRDELHTTTAWASWLLTAFFLASTVSPPVLGRLGDQFGKRRLLLVSLGLFLAGSVGAVAAPDIWTLVACRAVQGLGGSIFPLSVAILRDELPRDRLPLAVGVVSTVFAVGGGLGVGLSGLIADALSWRAAFAIVAAAGAVSFVLVWAVVPESSHRARARVDFAGAGVLTAFLLCFLLALTQGRAWGWSSPAIVGLLAAAVAGLALWIAIELRVPEPMVDMRMLVNRVVLVANVLAFVIGIPLIALGVLVPLYAAAPPAGDSGYGFGADPTTIGLIV